MLPTGGLGVLGAKKDKGPGDTAAWPAPSSLLLSSSAGRSLSSASPAVSCGSERGSGARLPLLAALPSPLPAALSLRPRHAPPRHASFLRGNFPPAGPGPSPAVLPRPGNRAGGRADGRTGRERARSWTPGRALGIGVQTTVSEPVRVWGSGGQRWVRSPRPSWDRDAPAGLVPGPGTPTGAEAPSPCPQGPRDGGGRRG